MAKFLLQGLKWVWVGLQICTHDGLGPLLVKKEQRTEVKQGLRKDQL